MNLAQMRDYLQETYGIPIVLRKVGTSEVTCCYCKGVHKHDHAGYNTAGCDDETRFNGSGITVGDRFFVPNWGYHIIEFEDKEGVNRLIVPDAEP